MKLKIVMISALLAVLCPQIHAQAWTGVLDPSRAVNWSAAGVPGGIPDRTTVCQTVAPSGLTDNTDSTNINNALAACAGTNEVVQLEAGTYTIANGISFATYDYYGNPTPLNDVTLRGAGPDKTILKFTAVIPCGAHANVCFKGNNGWGGAYAGAAPWTGGYSKGSSSVTLGSITGSALSVGQIIILDQRDDALDIVASPNGFVETGNVVTVTTSIPHGFSVGQTVGIGGATSPCPVNGCPPSAYTGAYTITAVPSPKTFQYIDPTAGLAAAGGGEATVDTGGVYVSCVGGATCSNEGGSGVPEIGRGCPDGNPGNGGTIECQPGEVSSREQTETKLVTAINGNQISISPPLEMPNWRASQNPGAWWTGKYIEGSGIEALTLDNTNDNAGDNIVSDVTFQNAYDCWMKNVRSIQGDRSHVSINTSFGVEVVDSYFFGTKAGGAKSYGVSAYEGNANLLIENNICQHVVSCTLPSGDAGSVYGYNYMVDSGVNAFFLAGMLNENHDFSFYDLFEGNDTDSAGPDDIHGDAVAPTTFRNRLRGQDTPIKYNSLIAGGASAFDRFANFVGNVMGTRGAQTQYQTSQFFPSGYIWNLGVEADNVAAPTDPLTIATLLRWGSYDVVSGGARWCGDSSSPGWSTTCGGVSEIPTSSFTDMNGNAVPSTTALPASFYLPSQPAFWQTPWGTPPWPAIGPDVEGGTAPDGVAGYSYAIPAQLCYTNTPIDPAYQQTFTVSGGSWTSATNPPTATLTIGPNALAAGNAVTISVSSPSGYDGIFAVTSATSTTVSYLLPNNPGPYASGGTLTYPNILLFNAAACYPKDFAGGGAPAPPSNLTATPH